ncbi:hypothetical protein Tco_1327531 [Tanacetum coccineum]
MVPGVTRPKINTDTHFKLNGQFLKELRDNTFSGSEHEDANEHIEKVLKIVNLFHISNITQDQIMLQTFPVSLAGAASRWLRNEPAGSVITWEEIAGHKTSLAESAKRHEENSNIIKEIQASTDAAIRNQRALIKTLEIQIGQMSKVLQETGFGSLPSSMEMNPRDHVKYISTTKADSTRIHRFGSRGKELKILETWFNGTTLHDNPCLPKDKAHVFMNIDVSMKTSGCCATACRLQEVYVMLQNIMKKNSAKGRVRAIKVKE